MVDCGHYRNGQRTPGEVKPSDAGDLARAKDGFVWIGLHEPTQADIAQVAAEFQLPELAVDDAVKAHQRPKIERYDNVVFVILKPVTYHEGVPVVSEVALFIGEGFLVAVRHGQSDVLSRVRKLADSGEHKLGFGPMSILYRIMDAVVDDYELAVEDLGIDIDDIESAVFGVDEADNSQRIYRMKRSVAVIRRAVQPLVYPLKRIVDGEVEQVPTAMAHYFRDVLDHLTRATDAVEAQDRMLSDVLQADAARMGVRQAEIALRQNEDMRKISAWAAIGLLPTAVAGIYGMNFQNMPELTWRYGYFVVLAVIALACGLLYRNFRKRDWL